MSPLSFFATLIMVGELSCGLVVILCDSWLCLGDPCDSSMSHDIGMMRGSMLMSSSDVLRGSACHEVQYSGMIVKRYDIP
mmetsp:Transcript_19330/g.64022  ORF Transcript_19330/g.64022 Transcript_19330/m.64022 type:complete len:80 (-) Transcript_19330:918-1157(-)